jgi:N-acyl-D-aspartate/D-glutamate deacylase
VETAMQQGALGVSSSLIIRPVSYAQTAELVALARVAARHGGSTPRTSATRAATRWRRWRRRSHRREAKIPVEIWHLKVAGG